MKNILPILIIMIIAALLIIFISKSGGSQRTTYTKTGLPLGDIAGALFSFLFKKKG